MSNIDRAIHLSNQLNDLVLSITGTAEEHLDRIGKTHPEYASCSRDLDTLLEISDLLNDIDSKLHNLDREEVIE